MDAAKILIPSHVGGQIAGSIVKKKSRPLRVTLLAAIMSLKVCGSLLKMEISFAVKFEAPVS